MFLPVHAAVGAIIDKAAGTSKWKKILVVPILAFVTHPLLDYFNCGAYTLFHGPLDPWLNFIVIGLGALALGWLILTARKHWLGMLFACIADAEWAVFGLINKLGYGDYAAGGLHHKLFWPHILTTEWGLVVQLGLLILLLLLLYKSK
jgi:hypothetical protein